MGKFFSKISNYFKEVRLEFRKVVWPPFDDVTVSVGVVISTVAIAAVLVFTIDFVYAQIIRLLF
ncbi:MAG: preprotein translocase subunit SecE [Spirochaetales bacterium]|nr:preprotein translocase subunit SecE [Spirochaetales bacterium]